MQVVETKNEGLSREFTITVAADELDQKVETKLIEVGQTVKMPGCLDGTLAETSHAAEDRNLKLRSRV